MIKNKKNFMLLIIKIAILIISFLIINTYIFGFYVVRNNNYRTINITPHDLLIYYKLNNNYQNNDIIVYKNKIYRVIGTNGQVINKKGNKIFVDSDIIDEVVYDFNYPYTIPKNQFFVIGYKDDSRTIGCINKKDISGKLVFRMQIRDF